MSIPLPTFSGFVGEPWDPFESRLDAWLRSHSIPDSDDSARLDCLLLALPSSSPAATWYSSQQSLLRSSAPSSFPEHVSLLRARYGNELRRKMNLAAALNRLDMRSFRDPEHKKEMVSELVDDLEMLMAQAGIEAESSKREYLLRCFRGFSAALQMMARSPTYDGAVWACLQWESSVISNVNKRDNPSYDNLASHRPIHMPSVLRPGKRTHHPPPASSSPTRFDHRPRSESAPFGDTTPTWTSPRHPQQHPLAQRYDERKAGVGGTDPAYAARQGLFESPTELTIEHHEHLPDTRQPEPTLITKDFQSRPTVVHPEVYDRTHGGPQPAGAPSRQMQMPAPVPQQSLQAEVVDFPSPYPPGTEIEAGHEDPLAHDFAYEGMRQSRHPDHIWEGEPYGPGRGEGDMVLGDDVSLSSREMHPLDPRHGRQPHEGDFARGYDVNADLGDRVAAGAGRQTFDISAIPSGGRPVERPGGPRRVPVPQPSQASTEGGGRLHQQRSTSSVLLGGMGIPSAAQTPPTANEIRAGLEGQPPTDQRFVFADPRKQGAGMKQGSASTGSVRRWLPSAGSFRGRNRAGARPTSLLTSAAPTSNASRRRRLRKLSSATARGASLEGPPPASAARPSFATLRRGSSAGGSSNGNGGSLGSLSAAKERFLGLRRRNTGSSVGAGSVRTMSDAGGGGGATKEKTKRALKAMFGRNEARRRDDAGPFNDQPEGRAAAAMPKQDLQGIGQDI